MELDSGKHDFSYFFKMETKIAKHDFDTISPSHFHSSQ